MVFWGRCALCVLPRNLFADVQSSLLHGHSNSPEHNWPCIWLARTKGKTPKGWCGMLGLYNIHCVIHTSIAGASTNRTRHGKRSSMQKQQNKTERVLHVIKSQNMEREVPLALLSRPRKPDTLHPLITLNPRITVMPRFLFFGVFSLCEVVSSQMPWEASWCLQHLRLAHMCASTLG